MNKKVFLNTSVLACMALLASCSDNYLRNEIDRNELGSNAYIQFSNYTELMSKASRNSTDGFLQGDEMAVWGTQTANGETNPLFINQKVTRGATNDNWTYSPAKLWDGSSEYTFYGFYPYGSCNYQEDVNHHIAFSDYVNPDATADQKDLMISEIINGVPYNVVNMIFHHIMSNVNISAKVDNDVTMDGISKIEIKSMEFKNVRNKGSYNQTGWDTNKRPTGNWTTYSDSHMNIAKAEDIEIKKNDPTPVFADYLMIPQALFETATTPKDVVIDATFKISYTDNTSSTFTKKGIRLAGISGTKGSTPVTISSWQPDCKYDYTMIFKPQQSTRIWDADGDGSDIVDPATGVKTTGDDTPTAGTMKYNPDDPDNVLVYDDTTNDGQYNPEWHTYPVAWEDIDGDDKLEAGIDRNGDGKIDNVDGDNDTNQSGDDDKDPTDGDTTNNPDGKDVILVHCDTDNDKDVDNDDEWKQVQKDKDTGVITPAREVEDATIKFSASVSDWSETYTATYDIRN